MPTSPVVSPQDLHRSGSMPNIAPLVDPPAVEVSEDSSCDDVDRALHNNTVNTRSITTTIRKKRKARRNSTPSVNRRAAEANHQCDSPPSKMQRSQSYSGRINRDKLNCDHSSDYDYGRGSATTTNDSTTFGKGGVTCPFPWKLHEMLDFCCPQNDVEPSAEPPIVIWNPTGTAFAVVDVNRFVQTVLPRFFAQSKYASFQRQLNLYGFTRASIPYIKGGKSKNISYYSHPCFIRGDHSKVQNMVRCKIKGTGKKRWCTNDDDQNYTCGSGDDCCYNNSPCSLVKAKNCASMPEVWVDDIDSPAIDRTDTPSEIRDGDLLFFDGIPFHFLNTKLDLNDSSIPDSDVDLLPFMLPPTFPALGSEVDLMQMDDVPKRNQTIINRFVPPSSRLITMDEKYDSYRNVSVSLENSTSNVKLERPLQCGSTILGVFDHHFHDIHSPDTPAVHRYKAYHPTKNPPVVTPISNSTPLDTWSNFHHPTTKVTAI